jgi:hypothetical protein
MRHEQYPDYINANAAGKTAVKIETKAKEQSLPSQSDKGLSIRFVSFFTADYVVKAAALQADLEKLGLQSAIERREFPNMDWGEVTQQKFQYVYDALVSNCPDSVCWLDADLRFVQTPNKILALAAGDHYDAALYRGPGGKYSSCVMWFANNDRTKTFLRRVIQRLRENPRAYIGNEIKAFEESVRESRDLIRIYPLPSEYRYLPGKTDHEDPVHHGGGVVIVHPSRTSL